MGRLSGYHSESRPVPAELEEAAATLRKGTVGKAFASLTGALRTARDLCRRVGVGELSKDLDALAAHVRARLHAVIRHAPLDGGSRVHPSLRDTEHEIAMARILRELGPTQAIECEQPHLFRGDHGYTAVRASSSTRSRSTAASITPLLARSMMRVAMTWRPCSSPSNI